MLKSGAFVSEPQQSYNATWRTLEPSEPKGKSNYNNIKWIIFHLQKEFYDWTCDHFNLSLICFNSVFRRLWPGQTTSRTLAFQMTFLIWMTSQYWYVDLYCIRWLFINNFFLLTIKTDQAHYTMNNFPSSSMYFIRSFSPGRCNLPLFFELTENYILQHFLQDLSFNQLTEIPRDLENSRNMLVLNLSHNR